MTNQEAIELIKVAQAEVEWNCPMDYATAFDLAIKALEQEPCEDAISRKAVMEHYSTGEIAHCHHISRNNLLDFVEQLPPVTPQPKAGHWIMTNDYYTGAYGTIDYVKCSCCHEDSLEEGDYCPNCGAKMQEVVQKNADSD